MPVFGAHMYVIGVHVCIMYVFCFVYVYLVCMYVFSLLCAHVCPLFLHMLCDLVVYAYHVALCHMCNPCASVICFMCACVYRFCVHTCIPSVPYHISISCVHVSCGVCTHFLYAHTYVSYVQTCVFLLYCCLPSTHVDQMLAGPLPSSFSGWPWCSAPTYFPSRRSNQCPSHGAKGFMLSPGSCTCSFQQPLWPHQDEISCLPPSNPGVGHQHCFDCVPCPLPASPSCTMVDERLLSG